MIMIMLMRMFKYAKWTTATVYGLMNIMVNTKRTSGMGNNDNDNDNNNNNNV